MSSSWLRGPARLGAMLVDPAGTIRATLRDPVVVPMIVTLVLGCATLGGGTLPRQLNELWVALAPIGDPIRDAQNAMMWRGLRRLALVDRLVPPAGALAAALLIVLAAEPVLALPRDRRHALWSVAVLGLAPLLALRMGELVITYLPHGPGLRPPGEVLRLPHQFVTGPLLIWPAESAPAWLHVVDARLNLITLWCVVLWMLGLRGLDGGRLAAWHLAVPLAALVGGGLFSWLLAPPVISLILGRP